MIENYTKINVFRNVELKKEKFIESYLNSFGNFESFFKNIGSLDNSDVHYISDFR